MRVVASGSWPVLVRLLAAIRQARPSMVADDLRVESPQLPTAEPVLPLTADFAVLAFRTASAAAGCREVRAPGTMLLGVLALALGGVVAAELAAPGAAPVAVPPMPGRVPVAAAAPAGVGRVDGWVGTILARPLFSPSRRPAATAAAAGPGGLPRLAGVIVGPEGKTVIFAAAGGRRADPGA